MRGLQPISGTSIRIIVAFGLVYVIWGSTYYVIKIAVTSIPPLLLAGTRFLAAGFLVVALAAATGHRVPLRQWPGAAVLGVLFFALGNGIVTWTQSRGLPSSTAALVVTTVPLWLGVFACLSCFTAKGKKKGLRPSPVAGVGLVVGFLATSVLLRPSGFSGVEPTVIAVAPMSAIAWALGSFVSSRRQREGSVILFNGLAMVCGGTALFLGALASGELRMFEIEQLTVPSLAAMAYLVFFGTIVAFTAYQFLLRHVSTTRVGTYAYVNPVVAVLLGWGLGGETITATTLVAMAVILGSVVMTTSARTMSPIRPQATARPCRPSRRPVPLKNRGPSRAA